MADQVKNIEVSEKVNSVKYYPYTFTEASARAFYCNAIVYINSGTSNVILNDIYTLLPGQSIAFNGNQNEVDSTVYKIQFSAGGANLLQCWIKEDAGNTKYNSYPANSFYLLDVDKREQDKRRAGVNRVKGEADNIYNNKRARGLF